MASAETLILLTFAILLAISSAAGEVFLSVSPKTLTKSNRTVHIQYSGVPSPSPLDWLGIYNPPNSADDHFIGYLFLNSSLSWPSGAGELRLPLVNLRSNYAFRLFRWTPEEVNYSHRDHDQNPLPGTRHRLAESGEVGFELQAAAEQVHLSFTDRGDEMRVVFVTGDGKEAFVRYGLEMEEMDRIVGTEVGRYGRSDMCDSPANSTLGWRDPGFIHDGVMTNLAKGKKYYYRVGSDSAGWSGAHSFISRDDEANETIAFLFGDMGTAVPYATFYRSQEESKSTVGWILRDLEAVGDKPSFISHIGDISYARGFSWIWDEFFNLVEPIASRVPYHVCIGNHEYDWPSQPWRPSWSLGVYGTDGGGECGVPYSLKFKMPGNSTLPTGTGAPHTRNLYYSFDAGVVHFLYISTETDFLRGSDQYEFIEADLRSVDREKTPFIVVQGHRPMYTTSRESRDAPMRERMLENLEPLFTENNVTLALWGHVHRYERFCPLRNHTCQKMSPESSPGATVHVVIGMGGQDWQASWKPRPDHPDVPIFPQPKESLYRAGEFGYTKLVATREKLTLNYIGNHDGEVHDTLEILSGRVHRIGDARQAGIAGEFEYSRYLAGASFLMMGTILGYALGFVTRRERENAPKNAWTPVKNEES